MQMFGARVHNEKKILSTVCTCSISFPAHLYDCSFHPLLQLPRAQFHFTSPTLFLINITQSPWEEDRWDTPLAGAKCTHFLVFAPLKCISFYILLNIKFRFGQFFSREAFLFSTSLHLYRYFSVWSALIAYVFSDAFGEIVASVTKWNWAVVKVRLGMIYCVHTYVCTLVQLTSCSTFSVLLLMCLCLLEHLANLTVLPQSQKTGQHTTCFAAVHWDRPLELRDPQPLHLLRYGEAFSQRRILAQSCCCY